jgi:hypothetical protein
VNFVFRLFEILFFFLSDNRFRFFIFTDAFSGLIVGSWILSWHRESIGKFFIFSNLKSLQKSQKQEFRGSKTFLMGVYKDVHDREKVAAEKENPSFSDFYKPSISIPISIFISAAYSSGSSFMSGEMNPRTISVLASSSGIP